MDVAENFQQDSPDFDIGELIKNLLVSTAAENFEFSGSVPQLSKLF